MQRDPVYQEQSGRPRGEDPDGHISGGHRAHLPCWVCLTCKRSFSVNVSKPVKNHFLLHKNLDLFTLLVNRVAMRRICKIALISQKTLYDKIHFIHGRTMAFVAPRERRLLTGEVSPERLYLSVDRQNHLIKRGQLQKQTANRLSGRRNSNNASNYVFALRPEIMEMEAAQRRRCSSTFIG